MKLEILATIILISFIQNFCVIAETPVPYLSSECLDEDDELVKTTLKDKEDLLNALKTIVPKVYSEDNWEVSMVKPLLNMKESAYYGMATALCNEKTAKKTWYVELLFTKHLPSASASTGIMFVTKTKSEGWRVWYQYK
ncbi:hypothetical protein LCL95_17870 [Bacillus timonensis]|nr:hypothetical protein [Bacillus timonensis]